ncbi:MAG: alpha/beta hydrolase [Deltaproteobacteria bacterium]|nr:alpha/beta hydrolase [Deltaproteobacteria bacterium]
MTEIKKLATHLGTIRYRTTGAGKPLLLVHGLFSSMDTFLPLFDAPTWKRQLVAFEFPDHGDSVAGPDFRASWAGYGEVIQTVADSLGFDTFALCGHSMGGGVAAWFAGQHPERVSQMILIDSVTARFRLPLKGRIPQIPLLGDLIFKVLYREGMFDGYFRNDVFFDQSKLNPDRIRDYYRGFDNNRHSILKAVRATHDPGPVVDRLTRIEAETLVIWGRQDALVPLFVGNETVRKVKRASLRIIDDCGHSPVEECPEQTIRLIREFLTD